MATETNERTPTAGPVPTCSRLWGVPEVAEFLGVPVATIHQWRNKREGPPAMRIGKYLRFDPERVRMWASQQVS